LVPKRKSNGQPNPTYDNLPKTSRGDLIFSYTDALIKAVDVIEDQAIDSPKPPEFGKAGDVWDADGYLVKVRWTSLQSPFFSARFFTVSSIVCISCGVSFLSLVTYL